MIRQKIGSPNDLFTEFMIPKILKKVKPIWAIQADSRVFLELG